MAQPRYIVRFLKWTGCGRTHKTSKDQFTDENKKSDKPPSKLINTLNRIAKFARCVTADRFGEFCRIHVGQPITKAASGPGCRSPPVNLNFLKIQIDWR